METQKPKVVGGVGRGKFSVIIPSPGPFVGGSNPTCAAEGIVGAQKKVMAAEPLKASSKAAKNHKEKQMEEA